MAKVGDFVMYQLPTVTADSKGASILDFTSAPAIITGVKKVNVIRAAPNIVQARPLPGEPPSGSDPGAGRQSVGFVDPEDTEEAEVVSLTVFNRGSIDFIDEVEKWNKKVHANTYTRGTYRGLGDKVETVELKEEDSKGQELVGRNDISTLPTGGMNGSIVINGKQVPLVDSDHATEYVQKINAYAAPVAAKLNEKNQLVLRSPFPIKIRGPKPLLDIIGIKATEESPPTAPRPGPGPQVGTGQPNKDKYPKD